MCGDDIAGSACIAERGADPTLIEEAGMTTIDLVTGFLGAGKTTFILDYARELIRRGERISSLA